MNLTTKQAGEKLGLKPFQVRKLVKDGKLASIKPADAKARVNHQFDPKVIRAYKKAQVVPKRRASLFASGHPATGKSHVAAEVLGEGITARLERIETAVAKLTKLWS